MDSEILGRSLRTVKKPGPNRVKTSKTKGGFKDPPPLYLSNEKSEKIKLSWHIALYTITRAPWASNLGV